MLDPPQPDAPPPLDVVLLAGYRRRVADLYAEARRGGAGEAPWEAWRAGRDELLGTHPLSPVPDADRTAFTGAPFFAHDPRWRVRAELETDDPAGPVTDQLADGFRRVGSLRFEYDGATHVLSAYWLDAYGGGLFVPFGDDTNGGPTYGGGRYVLDTAKGAELGAEGDRIVVDFNYAYHPSCAWDARWSCPLAPTENRLAVAVTAGERLVSPPGGGGARAGT